MRRTQTCLEKLALRLKGLHGTHGAWKRLVPFFKGPRAGGREVNPRAVYAGTGNRRTRPLIESFAREATRQRGGHPHVGKVVVDTQKGWGPSAFTRKGRDAVAKELGRRPTNADLRAHAEDLITEGDSLKSLLRGKTLGPAAQAAARKELGNVYRQLHGLVGSWSTPRIVRPLKWRKLP